MLMPSLFAPGSNLKPLLRNGDASICRRRREEGDTAGSALAVVSASDSPASSFVDRLRHEYELKSALEPDWAARPMKLVQAENRPLLLLEDPGGEFLEGLLGKPMEPELFLRFAAGIAKALTKLHQRGLIHKDIKPAHILVDQDSGTAWLTGFGIASPLRRERQTPEPPETLAGTLAYMAPEQTGRMNRSVDARSDLYSLGVTFYQMLTGDLPFEASDPMELVHCHIAKSPVPPAERLKTIPALISAIVMKLLAKTAEERYQTAAGLESDLLRCLAKWKAQGRIAMFRLGQRDIADRLLIPEKLYGREQETQALLAAFQRVAKTGTPELVLVSGYSGVGKSSVVNELHKVLVPPRGLFASGKFDQYKREIPYATLALAFERLILPLLGKSETELSSYRRALKEALGPNGQLVVDLVPDLKLIVGEQPPVPELEPNQAKARFQLVFRRFIGVFARPEHPLALFLDDLQWLDAATFDLVEDLLTQEDVRHLLLIGAYRDNEVDAAHPLMRKLHAIRKASVAVQEITLAPLGLEDVTRLITDALHSGPKRASPLARLVHAKTAGNPFFVIQFLSALSEEGLVTFDHGAGRWAWDLGRIQAKGCAGNVADLMVRKLSRLPHKTQNALQQLACLGNTAATSTLALVLEAPEGKVEADLQEAVRQELVQKFARTYRFLHDRVQEAAYSLIPKASRAEAHLRIGRVLLANTAKEKREEAIFEIVGQLNRGAGLISSQEDRAHLAKLNLVAGKRAKASTAYASALNYLLAGLALLQQEGWERRHKLVFQLELNSAECEYLTGEFAAAEQRLEMLAGRAGSLINFAAVTCLRVNLFTAMDRCHRAVAAGLDYLAQAGVQWSPHPAEDDVRQEFDQIWSHLRDRAIQDLIGLPLMTGPASRANMDVLTTMLPPTLFTDQNLFGLVVGRMANMSIKYGHSDGSCLAFVWLGLLLGPRFGNYRAAFAFGQLGFDLVEKRSLDRFRARVYLDFSHVIPWAQHARLSLALVRRAFDAAHEAGDLTFASFSSCNLVSCLLATGDPLPEVQEEAERLLAFVLKIRFGLISDIINGQLRLILALRGLTPAFASFNGPDFDEVAFERHLDQDAGMAVAIAWYWVRKLQGRFFAGDYRGAIEAACKVEQVLWTMPSHLEVAEYHYYAALSRAAVLEFVPADEREQHTTALASHHEQLQIWAKHCPANFEDRHALVSAEIARIERRALEPAISLYDLAIRSARSNRFVHNEALAHELAARFCFSRGLEATGLAHLREARACYALWGAAGKVRQLDQHYPQLSVQQSPAICAGRAVQQLDAATALKASQAVSGEIELPKLIETLMTIALENAGANRGLLILPEGANFQVEVEAVAKGAGIEVRLRRSALNETECPEALINYVIRAQKSVILDDGLKADAAFADAYLRGGATRSVFCLPLLRQAKLAGVLYLENNAATHAFTPDRIGVLELLSAQAAISIENARLYKDLSEREARIRRLVDANIIGIFIWNSEGEIIEANDAFLKIVGYERQDAATGHLRWTDLTPPEWLERDLELMLPELLAAGLLRPFEKEYFRKDGSRVPVLIGAARFEESGNEGVAFVVDLTESKEDKKRLQAMVDELNHRVKNTLATVRSLSAQTLRNAESPKAFHKAFEGRLLALSQTHNLLNRSHWTRVSLRELLMQELAPYSSADSKRLILKGEVLKLDPVVAVTLGMAFHELAINAAKYGALSVPDGSVKIAWRTPAPGRLRLEWQEAGGPPVFPPKRRGFGSRLLEKTLPAALDGKVRLCFAQEGVCCEMDIAVDPLQEQ